MARDPYEDDEDDRPRRRRDEDGRREEDDYDDRPRGAPPANYLGPAILATLLCCIPAGIVAIVFAAQVNSKWEQGDYAGARKASANAKLWSWVSFGLGLVVIVLGLILQVLIIAAVPQGQGP